MKLSLKRSNPSGVKIATQGSSHFARTRPSENEARNFAGIVRRFFASSEYSKWPLNATYFFQSPGRLDRPESRSGRSPATPACLRAVVLTHIPPLCNLFPHLSASSASVEGSSRARRRIPMRFFARGRGGRSRRKLSCSGKRWADGLVRADRAEHCRR